MKKILAILLLFCCFSVSGFSQSGSEKQRLAHEYFLNGEYEKAIATYEEIYEQTPSQVVYLNYLSALIQQESYKQAEKLARRHLKKFPNDPQSRVDIGYVMLLSGDKKGADKYLQSVLNQLPEHEYAVAQLSQAFAQREQLENAAQVLLRGRKNDGDDQLFAAELANIYEQQGKASEMMQEYLNLLRFNDPLLPYIQTRLQAFLANHPEKTTSEQLRKALMRHIQVFPEDAAAQELLIWLMLHEQQYELALTQAKAFEKRFQDRGRKVFELAELLSANGVYKTAETAYRYILDQGAVNPFYLNCQVGLLENYYQEITTALVVRKEALLALESAYLKVINENPKTEQIAALMVDLARIYAYYDDRLEAAQKLLEEVLALPRLSRPFVANAKLSLADILLFSGQVWEATLYYSQVEKDFKNDEIGFEAKLKNAKLFYYIGEFDWAESQLDVLKAATSKLIANDAMELYLLISENKDVSEEGEVNYHGLTYFSKADFLLYQNKPEKALITLDSITDLQLTPSLHDDVLYKKAEIKIQQKSYEEAQQLLEEVYTNYAYDLLADDALYLAARLNEEQLNNIIQAMNLYERILTEYPASLYTVDARKRFRTLRGDLIK